MASVSNGPSKAAKSAGTEIVVPNVELPRKIARVEVSASERRARAFDREHNVLPGIRLPWEAANTEHPTYHYDPDLNLKGVDVQEKLELPRA